MVSDALLLSMGRITQILPVLEVNSGGTKGFLKPCLSVTQRFTILSFYVYKKECAQAEHVKYSYYDVLPCNSLMFFLFRNKAGGRRHRDPESSSP